jgi:hypothetical protein
MDMKKANVNRIFHINAIVGRENAVTQLASKEVSRFRWHRRHYF